MKSDPAFCLTCRDTRATPSVLQHVALQCSLDELLFELTLRQTYRNTSHKVLEVVYTFPLLPQAVLLGFATELNGQRMVGRVFPKRDAEEIYEEALADGDAPVMLEANADGLYTANIGNLKPNDELVVELRMAQVVRFEHGRLRIAIPSTVAPRYGDPQAAGLQPQQVPTASLTADYPLEVTLDVRGTLTNAVVECPSHPMRRDQTSEVLRFALQPGARLDRDVVWVITPPVTSKAFRVQAADKRSKDAPNTVLLALPIAASPARAQIALKLLVDCSGSMAGDSIQSARRALRGVLAQLTDQDSVSLSRFGSTVQHVATPALCKPAVRTNLTTGIDATNADLGGTEMEKALRAVVDLHVPENNQTHDVLLITDGEIWQVDPMIAAARRSGHRVFVIGVGTSPAESVLRRLAEATGGACEFATPGEALEAAAARMMARIRQVACTDVQADWGCQPVWQSPLPLNVFGGDTLVAFAGMPANAAPSSVRVHANLSGAGLVIVAATSGCTHADGDGLPRLGAASRLTALNDEAAAALAVQYQLMSQYTNCVLVHQRTDADKATEDAELHRVESMLAAGWGGTGSVEPMMAAAAGGVFAKCVGFAEQTPSAFMHREFDLMQHASPSIGGYTPASVIPLSKLAEAIKKHLQSMGQIKDIEQACQSFGVPDIVRCALDQVEQLGVERGFAWLLLVRWIDVRTKAWSITRLPASAQLRLSRVDAVLVAKVNQIFDQVLVNCVIQ